MLELQKYVDFFFFLTQILRMS